MIALSLENRWVRRLTLATVVLVACIVMALLAEAGVRVRQWLKHGDLRGIEDTYMTDPVTSLRIPIPNSATGPIRINSLGFRSPEIPLPKPKATVRIAFLGASTTYCAEVSSNEATWPHLVVEAIRRRWPERSVDYVNAAVPGYTVETSLHNLERRVKRLAPDVIVIYHATNDLSGNSYDLAVADGLVEGKTEEGMSLLSRYSTLAYLVEKNLMVLARQHEADDETEKLRFRPEEIARPFRRDLLELVRESRKVAPLVYLVTFSPRIRPEQSDEDRKKAAITSLYYMPYMTVDGILAGFEAYNRAIREIADATGAELIGGETMIPGDGAHYVDSVHFTDRGSRAMAERVGGAILASKALGRLMEQGPAERAPPRP